MSIKKILFASYTKGALSVVREILFSISEGQKLNVSYSCYLPRTQFPSYISSKYVYSNIFSSWKSNTEVWRFSLEELHVSSPAVCWVFVCFFFLIFISPEYRSAKLLTLGSSPHHIHTTLLLPQEGNLLPLVLPESDLSNFLEVSYNQLSIEQTLCGNTAQGDWPDHQLTSICTTIL